MAKFSGANMIATFKTWGIDGLTEVEVQETADVTEQAISGQSGKAQIVGVPSAVFTLDLLMDNATPVPGPFLTALTPGVTGTFTFDADRTGTFGGSYSGIGLIRDLRVTYPVEGFTAIQAQIGIDGALTKT
jgi:hypothetical protein